VSCLFHIWHPHVTHHTQKPLESKRQSRQCCSREPRMADVYFFSSKERYRATPPKKLGLIAICQMHFQSFIHRHFRLVSALVLKILGLSVRVKVIISCGGVQWSLRELLAWLGCYEHSSVRISLNYLIKKYSIF